jgi:hypothetical protein
MMGQAAGWELHQSRKRLPTWQPPLLYRGSPMLVR